MTKVAVFMLMTFDRTFANNSQPSAIPSATSQELALALFVLAYCNLSFVIRCVTIPELQQRLKIKMFTSKREILEKKTWLFPGN